MSVRSGGHSPLLRPEHRHRRDGDRPGPPGRRRGARCSSPGWCASAAARAGRGSRGTGAVRPGDHRGRHGRRRRRRPHLGGGIGLDGAQVRGRPSTAWSARGSSPLTVNWRLPRSSSTAISSGRCAAVRNFGVVVSFDFIAQPVRTVHFATITYRLDDPKPTAVPPRRDAICGAPQESVQHARLRAARAGPAVGGSGAAVTAARPGDDVRRRRRRDRAAVRTRHGRARRRSPNAGQRHRSWNVRNARRYFAW